MAILYLVQRGKQCGNSLLFAYKTFHGNFFRDLRLAEQIYELLMWTCVTCVSFSQPRWSFYILIHISIKESICLWYKNLYTNKNKICYIIRFPPMMTPHWQTRRPSLPLSTSRPWHSMTPSECWAKVNINWFQNVKFAFIEYWPNLDQRSIKHKWISKNTCCGLANIEYYS